MSIHGALREFANTMKEWHYIVSSFFTGAIVGFSVAIWLVSRLIEANRDNSEEEDS